MMNGCLENYQWFTQQLQCRNRAVDLLVKETIKYLGLELWIFVEEAFEAYLSLQNLWGCYNRISVAHAC